MSRQFASIAVLAFVAFMLALPAAPATAEPSPWWQVLTGSRPTNLWEPEPSVQEVELELVEPFPGFEGTAAIIEVGGAPVGCLGSQNEAGFIFCFVLSETLPGGPYPPTSTAAELQALLQSAWGTSDVEVTGGPAGDAPFQITAGGAVPALNFPSGEGKSFGEVTHKVISPGGSGRLILTLTNLGNAPVDGSTVPVTIKDELPEGAVATGVEAVAGFEDRFGSKAKPPTPVECDIEAPDLVGCSFDGVLPPYEAIEIEVFTSLTGDPPAAGAPGTVTVSGGNAPADSETQTIKVSPEKAPFGFEHFSVEAEEHPEDKEKSGGGAGAANQAGGHPFQLTTTVSLNSQAVILGKTKKETLVEQPAMPRNLNFPLPLGLVGNLSKIPQCEMSQFFEATFLENNCPSTSAIGVATTTIIEPKVFEISPARIPVPVFNLTPAQGEPARFGFNVKGTPVVVTTAVDPDNDYRIVASVRNTTQLAQFLSSTVALWGSPGDPRHDESRGWGCTELDQPPEDCVRPPGLVNEAFLRMPVSCQEPLGFDASMEPWNVPPGSVLATAFFQGEAMHGCNKVPLDPTISASATSKLASSPTGFDFRLDMPNSGLSNPKAIAEGQAKKVEVTLPEGMTINPSQAEGLVACSPQQYAQERFDSAPGAGCPEASKVGEVQITTPLLKEEARGSLYVAEPFNNPFNSLIALYMVARIPERGILIKQAGLVETNPQTGQIVSTFDNLPQVPFSSFKLRFREGGRAPLVTPPACGSDYKVVARFTPWSAADPNNPTPAEIVTRTSTFPIERGVDGGACPSGGIPPFRPGLLAGTINNAAGKYSPFNVRLTRNDGEQEFTNFSIKLPPGVIGKLAGIPFCSDAAIAAAKARTGPAGGAEELASPSCPAASQIGRTLVGSGVGSLLTYVPGSLYMAGPYNGAPLSIVSVTAAKVGPFDLGTVVLRLALRINPETAEVFVDPTNSDPIPHIIQGVPVHARDIRAYVDRPEFVLNPTSCEPTSTASTVLGSGLDFGSAADDVPVTVTSPFQAADCASLGFKPKLELSLKGKTRRGGNPALKAVMRPRMGDANAARISVALPRSEFLDQSHIRTVCTRVQFKAGAGNGTQCPRGAIYGRAKAWTPLLDKPLEGPVFLRSSENPLPDMVLALRGLVDVHAVGRIDSINGGIRVTFDFVPDAPLTKAVVEMGGGRKSLLENSTNICRGKHSATVKMKGHNGRLHNFQAPLKASCGKSGKQGQRKGKS